MSSRFAATSQFTVEPSSPKNSTIRFTSVMSGTLRRVIGASLNSVAHSTGSTAFLFAEGSMRPVSGLPPRTSKAVKSVSHQLEDFLTALRIAAEKAHDMAGDHHHARRAHAARGHAGMASLDNHRHPT